MITALDSSVLGAIVKREAGHEGWVQALLEAAGEGPLVISPVAFAELSPSTASSDSLLEFLDGLAIGYDPISPAAAFLAGQTFKTQSRRCCSVEIRFPSLTRPPGRG